MDKSRQYIQMCKTSKEIQRMWKAKAGDFYVNSNNKVLCWAPGPDHFPKIKRGFGIESKGKVTRIFPLTWLPKLDQLIEASQSPGLGIRNISFIFYEWVKRPYGKYEKPVNRFFSSLEQMWLAFIMFKKFSKTWYEDDWVPL